MMKPPPTPSNPEKNPVAPPTTRLSVSVSRVMDVLHQAARVTGQPCAHHWAFLLE